MDNVLSSKIKEDVITNANNKVNALLKEGHKNSSLFCLFEDSTLLVENMILFIKTTQDILKSKGYRVNPKAKESVCAFYNFMKVQENSQGAFKFTLACSLDGIPAIFLSFYSHENPNISTCGNYEQPDNTIRVPLIFGCDSVFERSNLNKSPMTTFGITRSNLNKVRTRRTGRTENFNEPRDPNNVKQETKRHSRERHRNDSELDFSDIPDNISHESTIVDSIATRRYPRDGAFNRYG